LKRMTRCSVRTVLSHPAAIKTASDTLFDTGSSQVNDLLGEVGANDAEVSVEREQESIEQQAVSQEDAPAVKLMNLIILRALKEKASDIHVEPGEGGMRVRYRVDGSMYEVMRPPTSIGPALLSRLKIMSSLDIAERFAPQDGKFQIRFENRKIDFRLS